MGDTFLSKTDRNIYAAVHKTNKDGQAQTETELNETSAHELAHAIDMTATPPYDSAPSVNPTYNKYVLNDLLYLDYSFTEQVFGLTPRNPCQPTAIPGSPSVPAPLKGLQFKTAGGPFAPICDNAGNVHPELVGLKNSLIMSRLTSDVKQFAAKPSQKYPGGWFEVHSKQFANQVYMLPKGKLPAESTSPVELLIVLNGFYKCALDWAKHEASPNTDPVPSSGPSETARQCDGDIPTWYSPF